MTRSIGSFRNELRILQSNLGLINRGSMKCSVSFKLRKLIVVTLPFLFQVKSVFPFGTLLTKEGYFISTKVALTNHSNKEEKSAFDDGIVQVLL